MEWHYHQFTNYGNNAIFRILKIILVFYYTTYTIKDILASIREKKHPQRSIFLFFDIVHIIKCIRNNWLNLKDVDNAYILPKFDQCRQQIIIHNNKAYYVFKSRASISSTDYTCKSLYPEILYAPFQDIRNVFKSDKCNLMKRAPKLAAKACWPSLLERQNVTLALKISHETTSAGQLAWNIENGNLDTNQTEDFPNLINQVWKTINVNWVGKNKRFNDKSSAPIYPHDFRLQFLNNVVSWLDSSVNLPFLSGKLIPQTFSSFKHTCEALPLLLNILPNIVGTSTF